MNLLLHRRFLIQKYFTKGAFGKFYEALDEKSNNKSSVLIKISTELKMTMREYEVLNDLNKIMNNTKDGK